MINKLKYLAEALTLLIAMSPEDRGDITHRLCWQALLGYRALHGVLGAGCPEAVKALKFRQALS